MPQAPSSIISQMVEENLDLVQIVARQLSKAFMVVEVIDELESAAREGLVDAATRFEPQRGVPFRRYANHRVRGSVLDCVRRELTARNRSQARVQQYEAALSLNESLSEEMTAPAYAATPRDADNALSERLAMMATAQAMSLANSVVESEDVADETPSAEEQLMRAELCELVKRELESLPEPDQSVVRKHYLEGQSLEAIMGELGLSRSWGCRILARGMGVLQKRMGRGG